MTEPPRDAIRREQCAAHVASETYAVRSARARGVLVGSGNTQHNYFSSGEPVEWPVMVGHAPLAAEAFQERPGLVESAGRALAEGSAVITQVVAGDGGTGKTQLASWLFRQALPGLDVAVWAEAVGREAIIATYADANALLHRTVAGRADAQREAVAFLAWLETTSRPWMVVLDDLQDPSDLRGLWPTGQAGRVLVTTRRRDAALAGHRRHIVDVGVYTRQEAIDFLTRRLAAGAVPGTMDEAEDLAEDLGFLPLALSQATAAILDGGITCRQYRARFADLTRPLADLFDASTGDDYERTMSTTWALAIERANSLAPVGLAEHVLRLAAVLDPNGAPAAVYSTDAVLAHLSADPDQGKRGAPEAAVTAEMAVRALRNAHRLSLLTHDPGAGGRPVRMHALAQRATLEHLPEHLLRRTVVAAADALAHLWDQADPRDTGLASALRANAAILNARHATALWEPRLHAVLPKAGTSLGESGQVVAARDHFADLARTAETRLAPGHPDTLTIRSAHAHWQGRAGDPTGAAAMTERLLADRLRMLGPDHPDTLDTRNSLACWRGEAGDAAGAVVAFRQLLADRTRILGPDHPHTLDTRSDLAHARGEAGDAAGAAVAFRRLLADRTRVLGADHLDTLDSRNNLARWMAHAGDPAGAVAAVRVMLADTLRAWGPDHPFALTARHNLAHWTAMAGDPDGAVTAFEELLPDKLRILGPDHPDTLTTRHNIAYNRGRAGDPASAAAGLQEVLADRTRILGPDHPITLRTRHNLADWQGEAGDPAGALSALQELLADRTRVLGPDHPHTLTTRSSIARWRGETGDPAGAATALQELLADRLRILGPDHPHTLATRGDLARWRSSPMCQGQPGTDAVP